MGYHGEEILIDLMGVFQHLAHLQDFFQLSRPQTVPRIVRPSLEGLGHSYPLKYDRLDIVYLLGRLQIAERIIELCKISFFAGFHPVKYAPGSVIFRSINITGISRPR